ncbi:amino acid ABC transporter substrate-binding protein [Actinoplanes sp. ATCC 53533]|uniref:ABC transporter substrate-binding protein n=1 Tax=Actinoplanes sp. ATCC 53533 TaxID=1288362 RepID=UPI000F76B54A|nr:ABC transporter substrate-binding protein [Actinoplanes sp. ATCC 53533]RSM64040.1 amino acid ABC transporter substrate-binding protein [Actinoplanes sp. ATCC 53533]
MAVLTTVALLAVSGCTGSSLADDDQAAAGGPIHIGLVWPQSGVYKTVGDDFSRGWQLYLDTHGGKLGGHEIKTTVVDEADGKQAARTGIKKLVEQDRVDIVVGTISSDAVAAIYPVITEKKIPYVATGGRPDDLKDLTYTWHTSWQNRDAGSAIADYIRTNVKGSVYAIGPDYKGGWDQVGGFVDAYKAGGGKLANPDDKALFTPFPTTTNFLPYLNAVAATDAKAVFAFFGGKNAVDFVTQYSQSGLKLPLYAAGFTTEGAVLTGQGAAADGIFSSLNYAPDLDNPANRAFATEFQKAYTTVPDLYNVTAYDAALLLDQAIAAAGPNPTSASINAAIGKLGAIPSPRGDWRFGTEHSPIQPWYLRQVRADGRGRANVLIQTLTTLGK